MTWNVLNQSSFRIVVVSEWCTCTSSLAFISFLKPYQEDGHPGQANIVEGYCSIERVVFARCAVTVVLVPIDAVRLVDRGITHAKIQKIQKIRILDRRSSADFFEIFAILNTVCISDFGDILLMLQSIIVNLFVLWFKNGFNFMLWWLLSLVCHQLFVLLPFLKLSHVKVSVQDQD